jgi:hypothetical protein
MKRSTLIILLVAALGGAAVYYLEIKDAKPRDAEPETSKPAFAFKREDLIGLTVNRKGQNVVLTAQDGKWAVAQPLSAPANQSAIDSLIGDLINTRIERSLPASPDELKSYGLAEPAVTVEVKLKDNKTHRIKLGAKDFSNQSVYGVIDDGKDVSLLPISLLTSADKSVDDFRDLAILGTVAPEEINSINVKNANGSFAIGKKDSNWFLKTPTETAADNSEVNNLLSEITSAKASSVASEIAGDLAPFGLNSPIVTISAQLQTGGERQINVGVKNEGDDKTYFAKSSDRSQIFKIDQSLFDKLNVKVSQLLSKQLVKLNKDDVSRIQIKNENLTLVAVRNADGKLLVKEPVAQKDKEVVATRIIEPISAASASELIDKPTADIASKMSKPVVEVSLTTKDGKTTLIKISAADGDNVYVRVGGRSEIFKVSKILLDSLIFKITDVVI